MERHHEPRYRFRGDRAYLIAYTDAQQSVRKYTNACTASAADAAAEKLRAEGASDVIIRRGRPHMVDWVTRDDAGRPVRMRRAFPTKTIALAKLESLRFTPGEGRTWGNILAEYCGSAQRSKAYEFFVFRALACFEHVCRPRRLGDITPAMIDHYFAELRGGRVPSPTTSGKMRKGSPVACRQDYTVLRSLFNFCLKRGYLKRDVMATIERARPVNTIRLKPTPDEWAALLRAIPESGVHDQQAWHLFILIGAVTGIDRDDLLRIELAPVRPPNWEPFRFRLAESESGQCAVLSCRRTKSGRMKLFGLPPIVSDRLAARVVALPAGTQRLFPWPRFLRADFAKIKAAAGYKFTFQSLRAAAGTQQAEAAAMAEGAALLGHSSPDITRMHYVDPSRLAIAMAQRLALPELPPFPAYVEPRAVRPGRRVRTTGPA